jgi:hypothetical protein
MFGAHSSHVTDKDTIHALPGICLGACRIFPGLRIEALDGRIEGMS